MSGTIAIERPKLRAIRSMTSIPLSVFFAGNKVKIKMYPGMKRTNGKPKTTRIKPSIFSNVIGKSIRLHSMHKMISAGYFCDEIFIVLCLVFLDV